MPRSRPVRAWQGCGLEQAHGEDNAKVTRQPTDLSMYVHVYFYYVDQSRTLVGEGFGERVRARAQFYLSCSAPPRPTLPAHRRAPPRLGLDDVTAPLDAQVVD